MTWTVSTSKLHLFFVPHCEQLATPSNARLHLYWYFTIWIRMDILWISDVKQNKDFAGGIIICIRTIANETEFKFHVIIFLFSAPLRCETWRTQAVLFWGLLIPGCISFLMAAENTIPMKPRIFFVSLKAAYIRDFIWQVPSVLHWQHPWIPHQYKLWTN